MWGQGQQGPQPPPQQAVGPAGQWVLGCRSSVEAAGRPGSLAAVTQGLVGGRCLQGRQELDPCSAAWVLVPHFLLAGTFPHPSSPSLTPSFPTHPLPTEQDAPSPRDPSTPLLPRLGNDTHSQEHTGDPGTALRGPPCPPSIGSCPLWSISRTTKTTTGTALGKGLVGNSRGSNPFQVHARSQPNHPTNPPHVAVVLPSPGTYQAEGSGPPRSCGG